jgi:hypothetical protein
LGAIGIGGVHCTKDPEPTPLFSLYIYRALTYLQGKTIMLGIVLNQFNKKEYCIQGVLAFHDFTIHDPRKFMIFFRHQFHEFLANS